MTNLDVETIRTVATALEHLQPHACMGRFCETCTPGVFAKTLLRLIESTPIEMTRKNGKHVRAAGNGEAGVGLKSVENMPPARRIPPVALSSSLFDSLHLVEGRWMRLGDMNKACCYAAAAQCDRVASRASMRSAAFKKLAGVLRATGTIQQTLTEQKLVHVLGGNGRAEVLIEQEAVNE